MSLEHFNVDPNAPEDDGTNGFPPMPEGTYKCVVDEVNDKQNSKGTGRVLVVTFQVLEGECKGSKIFCAINYENASAKAQEMGQMQLSQACVAMGITSLANGASVFLDKICNVRTYIDKESNKSRVGGFSKAQGAAQAPQSPPNYAPPPAGQQTHLNNGQPQDWPQKQPPQPTQGAFPDDDIPY